MAAILGENSLLQVQQFGFTYATGKKAVLSEVNFSLAPGQFSLLLGRSGSGKTTLLKQLKPILAPKGVDKGVIFYQGQEIHSYSPGQIAGEIGFVFQQPDAQLVMPTVYEELSFGLENLGVPVTQREEIIADTVSFCGIEHLLPQKTANLSGGQKQLVNLCAVLCLRPKVLLLDEPFAQLDPESVRRLLEILHRLQVEMGVTIFMSEQRLELLWPWVDQVIFLEQGKTIFVGTVRDFAVWQNNRQEIFALPIISRIFAKSGKDLYHFPICLEEGKSLMAAWKLKGTGQEEKQEWEGMASIAPRQNHSLLLQGKEISFAYAESKKIVLRNLSLSLWQGQRLVLCGSNGAGKSTLLHTIAGICKPTQGKWQWKKKDCWKRQISFLSQQAQNHFLYDTPHEEFAALCPNYQQEQAWMKMLEQLDILSYLHEDLYDLSCGQQQRVALAMILGIPAAVYVLDEPTKNLDEENKKVLGAILTEKKESAVLLATHDLEFAAAFGNSFTTLCHGALTSIQEKSQFFGTRYWQTTATAKLFAGIAPWYSVSMVPDNWAEVLSGAQCNEEK